MNICRGKALHTWPFMFILAVFFLTSLLMTGWSLSVRAASKTTDDDVSLGLLIQSALEKNQELVSAAATAQRYNIRIPLLDKLSDPLLAFYYLDFPVGNISSGWTARENQEKAGPATKVNVRSVRGKILTGRDMVENQALWYDYLSEDLILQVTSRVRQNFYRLYFLDKIIVVTEQNLITLDSLIESSNASYAVGKVRQKDVLRAQAERYQLQADLVRLQQERFSAESTLNYLANQPIGTSMVPLLEHELTSDNLPEMHYTGINLISGLYNHRPLIKGYQALGGRFKAMRGMAQMYFNREVRDEAMFEADSGFRAIKAKGTDFYTNLIADMLITLGDLEKNRKLAKLYGRVIVPQGRQTFEAVLADFRVGGEDFAVILKALLDLNKDQVVYYQTLLDYMINMARLEELSGVSLNEEL